MVRLRKNLPRIPVNAIKPRVVGRRLFHVTNRFPNSTVAFETRPECQLPDPVAPFHSSLRLQISQLIPDATGGGVPEPVEGGSRWLHVVVAQPQVALQLIQHRLAGDVDAEVFEC